MERIAVLVASSPTAPSAQRAFQLVRDFAAAGNQVVLGLIEDGVLGAAGRVAGVPLAEAASVLVLSSDLALRAVPLEALQPGCRPCGYPEILEELMERCDRSLGAF